MSRRLDYCNSLLYGIANIDLTRLQHVQNWLACLVTKSPSFTCSVPLLCCLHWLPVRFRILFKINLLTYKTLHENQPFYLHSMLAASLPSCSLRSSMIIVFQSLGWRPTQVQELFTLVPHLFGTTSCCRCVQPIQLLPLRNVWRHLFDLAFSPIDTGMPDGLLMLRNCFIDFAVEHWFGCCVTESGFAGDIGTIEVWLIDSSDCNENQTFMPVRFYFIFSPQVLGGF